MEPATILYMSTHETQNNDWLANSVKDMKRQMDRVSGEIGKLVVAIQGDDLGNEGILPRVQMIEKIQAEQEKRLNDIENLAKKNQRYFIGFFTVLGAVGGTILKIVIDHIVPIKK